MATELELPAELSAMKVQELGISPRCRDFLKGLRIETLADLLQHTPGAVLRRPAFAAELAVALEKLERRRECPALAAYRESLTAPRPDRDEGPAPVTALEHALVILRRRREPMTLRLLRDEVQRVSGSKNLVSLRRELEGHGEVVFYPFGLHQWLGLSSWGREGIRVAALGAWTVLPVHLDHLKRQGQTGELSAEVLEVVRDLAEDKNHRELLRLLADWADSPHEEEEQQPSYASVQPALPPTSSPDPAAAGRPSQDQDVAPDEKSPEPVKPPRVPPVRPEPEPQPDAVREPEPAAYGGGLFGGLGTGDRLHRIAEPVVRALRDLSVPRSLCQVRPSLADRDWLKTWAGTLRSRQAAEAMEGTHPCFDVAGRICSLSECFGLLVLLLACEVARREAREGQVWNVIHPCFSPASRSLLFVNGQPRTPLRQSIEAACRRFQLHHAFGIEGAQAWYQSIFLQFGFTRRGIEHLPVWLSAEEAQSVAVATLQRESPEFGKLWKALSDFRRLRTPAAREVVSRQLEGSPFVLPEWRADLLQAALKACPHGAQQAEGGEAVAYPRLDWPEGEFPRFVVTPSLLFSDLMDPAYTLYQDDEAVARLFRECEGYLSDPGELELKPRQDSVHLVLAGDDSEDTRELELELWDHEALFTTYSLATGERLEAPAPGRPCALLLAEGVSIEPPAPRSVPCGTTGFRLHQFPLGLTPEHRLVAGGQELATLAEPRLPAWAEQVELLAVQTKPCPLPSRLPVELRVPKGVKVRWARFGRQPVEMAETMGGWRGEVLLEPDLASPTLRLHFGLEKQGERIRLTRSCRVQVQAVTAWVEGSWQMMKAWPCLLVREAWDGSFRFFPGEKAHNELGLIEGDVFSARPRPGTRGLGRLAGFGGALRLRSGPYNSPTEGYLMARKVVDQGLIRGLKSQGEGFVLELTRRTDGDDPHLLVWWDGKGAPALQGAAELECTEGNLWSGQRPTGQSAGPECVGLAYDGVRLGSISEEEFVPSSLPEKPEQAAGLMRWLHLPILRPAWVETIRALAHRHPAEFLRAWLELKDVPGTPCLRFEAEFSEWFAVVREVFRGFSPQDKAQAHAILERVTPEALLRTSPILLVRLARTAFDDKRLGKLRCEIAGCQPEALQNTLQELEYQAARDMRVDDNFVRTLLRRVEQVMSGRDQKPLERREQLNLGLASEVGPFRRALAVRLLTGGTGPVGRSARDGEGRAKSAGPRVRIVSKPSGGGRS